MPLVRGQLSAKWKTHGLQEAEGGKAQNAVPFRSLAARKMRLTSRAL